MQKKVLTKVNVTILVILVSIVWINAADECNTCMTSNSVMCINETHFQICNDGVSSTTKHACAEGKFCTNSVNICEATAALTDVIVSVCGADAGTCNKCSTNTTKISYACATKTQYNMCMDGAPLEDLLSCQTDEICSFEEYTKGGKICVPQCVAAYANYQPSCSSDVPPTTAPKPTPTPEEIVAICVTDCRAQAKPSYCFTKDASDCTRYFYCEQTGATYVYAIMNCEKGNWDNVKQDCSGTTCTTGA